MSVSSVAVSSVAIIPVAHDPGSQPRRHRRGRRPPDRLAAPERDVRHRRPARRARSTCCDSASAAPTTSRRSSRCASPRRQPAALTERARGAGPARLPRRAARGRRVVRAADRDGCAPEDFYSTTNHQTPVRLGGAWIEVERQRMDAAIVIDGGRAVCRKLRDIRTGDARRLRHPRHQDRRRSSRSAIASASRS